METTKLTRSATVIDRILKVLQGFAIAGVIVAAVFIPLTLILGEKIVRLGSTLRIGTLELTLLGDPAEYLDLSQLKLSIVVSLIGMILVSGAAWYCLRVLREILAPMKAGRPFAAGISDKLRTLAWTVLIGGGIAEAGRALSEAFEPRAYQIERLLNPEAVASVGYSWSLNLSFVAAALILLFLSYVFRCGEALQRDADETL